MEEQSLAGVLLDRLPDGGYTRHEVYFDTPQWEATIEWCRFHGLDTNSIPADSVIIRDEQAHVIAYTVYVRDADGRLALGPNGIVREDRTERGEAGPLPFPIGGEHHD